MTTESYRPKVLWGEVGGWRYAVLIKYSGECVIATLSAVTSDTKLWSHFMNGCGRIISFSETLSLYQLYSCFGFCLGFFLSILEQ